jgi:hypothetical protein
MSVKCLSSLIPPSYIRAEKDKGQKVQRRSSACSQ